MPRKRITQIFPWLLPIRRKQQLLFFYTRMSLDGNQYASDKIGARLPNLLVESSCPLYNRETGFDMVYQENKVFNLKLAADMIDHLVIRPNETFSFWKLIRHADRFTPYKEGLIVINGKLTTTLGGGMCQMSNLLFWTFLHTPLTILERHGHAVKDFPEPPSDAPLGVDATVLEGWVDLKVRNDTNSTFQIGISFDEDCITGRVYTDVNDGFSYRVVNGEVLYCREDGKIFEEVDILQEVIESTSRECIYSKPLYRNRCEIGYPLPAGTPVVEKG